MGLGLESAKLGVGAPVSKVRISKKYLVSTSIAEEAIFIPKPRKRVDFKLMAPGLTPMGGGGDIALPGSGKAIKTDVNGTNISRGTLGANGLTARFTSNAWKGAPNGYVKMEIDLTPTKRNDVIVTQEEGRQVNNKEIFFTQQYDSYGRPRIGFSREPYDFAATKYVSVTSQIAFQKNMQKTQETFDKYSLYGQPSEVKSDEGLKPMGADAPDKQQAALLGADKEPSKETPLFGKTSDNQNDSETGKISEEFFLGSNPTGKQEQDSKKEDRITAEESYKTQKVKIVDVFNMSEKSSDGSENKPASEDNQVKNINVTA
ncbi:hypothetical protein MNBD_NITROSPINAE04-355 [hydrothermal vent metagenome]|uniref:Uncharacterized protein n=1 Tax=hydrothermal vent metagenome TaxID=652676 RepID=A0A3B1CH86_9ZZZZ